jgi:hypothetical protein
MIESCASKAQALGVQDGMTGKEALILLEGLINNQEDKKK